MSYPIFIRDIATDEMIREGKNYGSNQESPLPRIGETILEPHQQYKRWTVVDIVHAWVSSGRPDGADKCLAVTVYVERKQPSGPAR
jgi:hypothetical protein